MIAIESSRSELKFVILGYKPVFMCLRGIGCRAFRVLFNVALAFTTLNYVEQIVLIGNLI